MTSRLFLAGLVLLLVAPPCFAATPAPTHPVSSRNLAAPPIPSDMRNLEAIIDKEESDVPEPVAPAPKPAPQPTILVMPSAAAASAPVREAAHEAARPADAGWHRWAREPALVFTACIALFTLLLAAAAGWYVFATIATSRRHLRAYVFVAATEISGVVAWTQPVAQLVVRNTGQTPAHEVEVYGNMIFEEFPLKSDLPVLVFSDPQLTGENIGPGSERYKWEYALTPLTESQIASMQAGTHALYVYGDIRYRDVFNKKRSTKYLYYTGGTMGIRDGILGGYPQGNEAI